MLTLEQLQNTKPKEVVDGWVNLMRFKLKLLSPQEMERSFSRYEKCKSCNMLKGTRCALCGCPLAAKTKSQLSKCPLGKW